MDEGRTKLGMRTLQERHVVEGYPSPAELVLIDNGGQTDQKTEQLTKMLLQLPPAKILLLLMKLCYYDDGCQQW